MQDFLFVKLDKKFLKILFSDILYVEAVKKYVRIVTINKAYLILASVCSVEQILPASQFCRVHRSHIVSLRHTTGFDNEQVYIGNKTFPIGKQYRLNLQERVLILSSEQNQNLLLDGRASSDNNTQ